MPRKPRNTRYLAVVGVVAVVLVAILLSLQPPGSPLYAVVRSAALLGYLFIFVAIVSSAYLRELVVFFGRPFIKVHHIVSVAGLVLITLHPLAVAGFLSDLGVFVPQVDSWLNFFQWGGPPGWYLLGLAVLAALLRKRLKRQWRAVHYLNYIAFLLGTVHAILIGSDVQSVAVRVIAIVMALVVVLLFVKKRLKVRGAAKAR